MNEYEVIATVTRSAGNDSVGSMWTETKIFQKEESISRIIEWVGEKINRSPGEPLTETLTITIAE